MDYKGQDGFKRNLLKFQKEWNWFKQDYKDLLIMWLERPWSSHRYVDREVEMAREVPYLYGHIVAICYKPLLTISIAFNLYFMVS